MELGLHDMMMRSVRRVGDERGKRMDGMIRWGAEHGRQDTMRSRPGTAGYDEEQPMDGMIR